MQSICTGVYISINLRSHHVCNQIAHMHCLVPCNPFAGVSASISVHVQHLCCPLLSNFLEIDLDQLVDIHHLHHHLQDCLLHDNTLPLQFVLMVVTSLMSFSIAFTIVDKRITRLKIQFKRCCTWPTFWKACSASATNHVLHHPRLAIELRVVGGPARRGNRNPIFFMIQH